MSNEVRVVDRKPTIKPSDLLYHELIGLEVSIVNSPDPDQIGLSGVVIDETHGLLIIDTQRGVKRIPKSNRIFRFTLPSRIKVEVLGDKLVGRPEERVKRV